MHQRSSFGPYKRPPVRGDRIARDDIAIALPESRWLRADLSQARQSLVPTRAGLL
jgi:hypothetical protein